MDKAEKIKAARKKLEEFKKHKQEPKDGPAVPNPAISPKPQEEPSEPLPHNEPSQQIFAENFSNPSISSYFDSTSMNSGGFDITQQQTQHHFASPQDFFNIPPQQQITPEVTQQEIFNSPQLNQSSQDLSQLHSAPQQYQAVAPPQSVVQDFFQPPPSAPQYTTPTPPPAQVVHETQSVAFAQPFQPAPDRNFDLLQQIQQHQDQIEQQNHQITQLKSEVEFHRSTAANLQSNVSELNRLRQETQSHLDVVKVLVSEKSNLMESLQKSEQLVKTKVEENDELQNRLNVSRHRVKVLESEVQNISAKHQPDPEAEARRVEELVELKIREFRESNSRLENERDEMKALLTQKRIELENLQKNFDHLNTELHLASVKISQLSDGSPTASDTPNQGQVEVLNQELAIKQQQITELYSIIDQVNRDKEASDNQYQNYVSHLTREMETLKESSTELTNENDGLVKREQELLKHVSDLERQIQQQIQKQKTYAEDRTVEPSTNEEVQKLLSQISSLTESNEALKSQLARSEAEKTSYSTELLTKDQELMNMAMQVEKLTVQTPNLSQLMTDFEDKSVAASRAISQNQDLKAQLEEMQRAFITMTNDKMELTEKLQSESHLCKEMKVRYDAMEHELKSIQEKWQFKEDEMIRLSRETTELEKKIYQQNIEIDRLRHYESKEYHGTEGILEKELENYKRMVETLTNKILVLETNKKGGKDNHDHTGHDHDHSHDHSHSGHSHSHEGHSHAHENPTHPGHSHSHEGHSHAHDDPTHNHDHCKSDDKTKHLLQEIEMLKMEKSELLKAINDFQMTKKSSGGSDPNQQDQQSQQPSTEVIIPNGDHKQVDTVPKSVTPSIATEEALEKLQARFRRTILEVAELTEEKQRLEHVVTQLQFETETIGEYITLYQYQRRLLKQKEHERDIQLKNLAADREKMNEKLLQLNGLIEKFVLQHTDNVELAKEATKFMNEDSTPMVINPEPHRHEDILKLKEETAGKILEILSDIKTANSMSYDSCVGVEHCSCCLGKLETV